MYGRPPPPPPGGGPRMNNAASRRQNSAGGGGPRMPMPGMAMPGMALPGMGGPAPTPQPTRAAAPPPPAVQGPPPLSVGKPNECRKGRLEGAMTVDGGEYYHNVITDAVVGEAERASERGRARDGQFGLRLDAGRRVGGRLGAGTRARAHGQRRQGAARCGRQGRDADNGQKDSSNLPMKLTHIQPRFMQPDLVLLESLDLRSSRTTSSTASRRITSTRGLARINPC